MTTTELARHEIGIEDVEFPLTPTLSPMIGGEEIRFFGSYSMEVF